MEVALRFICSIELIPFLNLTFDIFNLKFFQIKAWPMIQCPCVI
jgi:hypothetical protein